MGTGRKIKSNWIAVKEVFHQALGIIKNTAKYKPGYAILMALQQIINALIPAIQVVIIANFINTAIQIVKKDADISAIYLPLVGIIVTLIFSILSEKLVYFAKIKLTNHIRLNLNKELIKKYASLSYKHLENPKVSDLIERVLNAPENQYIDAYTNVLGCIFIIVLIISNLVLIIGQVFWGGILIFLCSIPLFYLSIKSGKANHDLGKETTKYVRRYNYFSEVLTGREAVEERTLFGYSQQLNTVWKDHFERARKMIFHTELKWWFKMKLGGVLTAVISFIITLALLPPVIKGTITIGMFMALINSTFNLVNRMSQDLTNTMDQFARNIENMKDIKIFMELSEAPGATDLPDIKKTIFEKLEFRNVKFKYPNTSNYVINGISFVIEKGKHYSFVGLNGSGKTTITKLITGLYQDFEGEILINNKSILEYPLSELKALCAIAHQDFTRYALSIKENLILGNINKWYQNDLDISKAMKLLELDEIVEQMPEGINTYLGKIKKGGIDLSGGQWQKIALARFILNDATLRILDEPTSALDPISESNMYEKFDKICKNETAIFISHRLGSTKLADIIYVIDKGTIIESGSHKKLMSQKNTYYNLYESQRSWYK